MFRFSVVKMLIQVAMCRIHDQRCAEEEQEGEARSVDDLGDARGREGIANAFA